MGVGVLIQLATEWASLHYVYEAELQLKVHIPNINIGFSCHIGSLGDGEVAESLLSHEFS